MTSVAVRVCPSVSVSTHRTSVAVLVYSCVSVSTHTGRPWLSISTQISTLVLGLSTLALPVDCLGDFGPHGLSVQYTQDVCGCPPVHRTFAAVCCCPSAHTGRPWLSVCVRQHTHDVCSCPSVHISAPCTHRMSVGVRQHTHDVCGCPSAHTGRPWLSISTHIRRLVLGISTLLVDCSADFGPRGLSVQYTRNIRGCPSAHTGRPWLSVCVCVCPSAHTGRPWLSISTQISTLVLGLSTLALPVDCLGDFGPRGLSVQYTQDIRGCPPADRTFVAVRGCPSAHTGRPWLSVCVRPYTHDVHGCPSVHISAPCTHMTSVGVRQHTQDVCGCPSAHTGRPWLSVCVRVCPSAHIARLWLSISTHISTLVLGISTHTLPVDCSADFGPRGLSNQYTHDIRGCPSAHTGRPWLSVCVRVCPSAHTGRPVILAMWAVCSVHTGHPWVSASTHRTSVAVRVCPSAHTGRPWLSINTHISTLLLGLSTLALLVDCLVDFGPRGLSVQYTKDVCGCPWLSISTHRTSVGVRQHTQDVRVCPSAHTKHLWLSLCTRVCVRQHIQDVRGWPSVHRSARWSLDSARWPFPWTVRMILAHVGCLFSTHRTSVGVCQHTQDVRVCSWLSVCVRVVPSVHTGHLWLSINTHINMLVLGLSTLTLPVDCSGDFSPRGLSVQYTQDVRGCPPAHTGHPWLSVCVRVCPSEHTGRPWLSISTHISTLALPVDCLGDFGPRGLAVQYTQEIRGCTSAHIGRLWVSVSTHRTSVAVRVCPTHRTSMAVNQYTYQHPGPWTQNAGPWTQHAGPSRGMFGTHINTLVRGLSTLTLPVDCSADFGPRRLSVQYTQDVRGCPPAHTGRPWLSVCVRVCPSVSVSTHRTSVAVHQYTYQHVVHTGNPWVSVSTHMMSLAVRQHTQYVHGLHIGRPWVSVSTHWASMGVRQHVHDIRGCPCVSVSTQRMSVAVHQYTYQHVGPWTQHAGPSHGLTHMTSVAVHQYTYQHVGPWIQHAGPSHGLFGTSVAVLVCPCVSVSTHRTSVAVHQCTCQHASPWTQHAGPSRCMFG
ncbi:hypothetical protein YC2023_108608 [Brassica napus]